MPQMTPRQARVVDPILTAVARGYEPQVGFVGDLLFPTIPVDSRVGEIIVFGSEAFTVTDTRRAPGSNTKRLQIAYSGENYSLLDHSLEALVPIELEEEAAQVGIELASNSIATVQDKMALEKEKKASLLATTAGNYPDSNKATLSGGNQFSHADSNPFAIIDTAKEAIRSKTGRRPNVMALGPLVLKALRNHAKVLDRISTASDRPPATIAQLQALFEIDQIVEAGAVEAATGGGFADMWGKFALLAYSAPKTLAQRGSMSYGLTYQLRSRPVVEQGYADRNAKSMAYPVTDAYQRVLVGNTAGYLISAAVA